MVVTYLVYLQEPGLFLFRFGLCSSGSIIDENSDKEQYRLHIPHPHPDQTSRPIVKMSGNGGVRVVRHINRSHLLQHCTYCRLHKNQHRYLTYLSIKVLDVDSFVVPFYNIGIVNYLPRGETLDATDFAIINELEDGRISFKVIADRLGLAEGTVRSRVRKLRNEGKLQITGLVDPEALDEHSVVMVGINVKDMDLVKKGEEFSKLRGVMSVCVVTGRFDLIITVVLEKDYGILEFYTDEVSKIENVQSVETFVVYKSFDLRVSLPD